MADTTTLLQEKFPFLTLITHLNIDYIGIVQHADPTFLHMYVLDNTFSADLKQRFLECGDTWWWESNRQIPINIFIRDKFAPFKRYLRIFAMKETEIKHGPIVNLKELMNKRVKRRTIQLVKAG